jgi:hypothetical protein
MSRAQQVLKKVILRDKGMFSINTFWYHLVIMTTHASKIDTYRLTGKFISYVRPLLNTTSPIPSNTDDLIIKLGINRFLGS